MSFCEVRSLQGEAKIKGRRPVAGTILATRATDEDLCLRTTAVFTTRPTLSLGDLNNNCVLFVSLRFDV